MEQEAAKQKTAGEIPFETFFWFAIALGVLLLVAQGSFYKADAQRLVLRLTNGDLNYPHHKLYLPLLFGFSKLLSPLHLSAFFVARTFSAFGVALGVALSFASFRVLGASLSVSRLSAAGTLFIPSVFFFGTTVELHGPFFAFAGLSFFLWAFLVKRSLQRGQTQLVAILLGASTAFASGVHASGMILPALLVPWFLARTWKQPGPKLIPLGLFLACHGLLLLLLANPGHSAAFLQEGFHHPMGIEELPGILWYEFLWPFLPFSFTFLLALRYKSARAEVFAFLVALVPYLGGSLRLIAGDPEFGAYLLPLAPLAAYLSVRALRGYVLLLILPALWVQVSFRQIFEREQAYETRVDGLFTATQKKPGLLLIGDPEEFSAFLAKAPEYPLIPLNIVAQVRVADLPQLLKTFDSQLREEWKKGKQVFLTQGGKDYLKNSQKSRGRGPLVLEYLQRNYRLIPLQAEGFKAWLLKKK
jgi:hypothetical protein